MENLWRCKRRELIEIEQGLPIFRWEVEKAVRGMKWRKAEGSDGVVVEMVEIAGEFAIEKIAELANQIYMIYMRKWKSLNSL